MRLADSKQTIMYRPTELATLVMISQATSLEIAKGFAFSLGHLGLKLCETNVSPLCQSVQARVVETRT